MASIASSAPAANAWTRAPVVPLAGSSNAKPEDAVSALRTMKQDGSTPLRTMGSISLNKALLSEGLVDYLQLMVFPVVTGQTGLDPIFAEWPDLDLELVRSRTFDGRTQLLQYVPTLH